MGAMINVFYRCNKSSVVDGNLYVNQ
jgi:hypothetical protein